MKMIRRDYLLFHVCDTHPYYLPCSSDPIRRGHTFTTSRGVDVSSNTMLCYWNRQEVRYEEHMFSTAFRYYMHCYSVQNDTAESWGCHSQQSFSRRYHFQQIFIMPYPPKQHLALLFCVQYITYTELTYTPYATPLLYSVRFFPLIQPTRAHPHHTPSSASTGQPF